MSIARGSLSEELASLARAVLAAGPTAAPPGLVVLAARPERWVVLDPQRHVVVKAFARDRGARHVVGLVLGSRAARSFDATARARARGIVMPEPLGVIDAPSGSVLVSAEVVGARGLRDAFRGLGSPAARRALTRAVAELLARVHEAGVYPSDLNDTNVLVAADGSPVLVDAEGLRFVGRVSERRRVRNVERLLRAFLGPNRVSRATRLRFLRAYASDRAATRALWRRVAERFAEKQATYGLADP